MPAAAAAASAQHAHDLQSQYERVPVVSVGRPRAPSARLLRAGLAGRDTAAKDTGADHGGGELVALRVWRVDGHFLDSFI